MLDTVTQHPTTPAPRRLWDGSEDAEAALLHGLGLSDEDAGRALRRSAKAVSHRRARLAQLAATQPAPPAPVGSDLDQAERRYIEAQAASDAAHDAYHDAMQRYVRPVADALRRAGVVTTPDDGGDCDEGEAAWRVVEALRRCGVEIRVPAGWGAP